MSKDITNPNGSAVVISYDSVEIHLARGYFFQIGKGKNKHEAIKNAIGYLNGMRDRLVEDGMRDRLVDEMNSEKVTCGKCEHWERIQSTDGEGLCSPILPCWVKSILLCVNENLRKLPECSKNSNRAEKCDCFLLRAVGEK
jgi:hypothetical protein